MSEIVNEGRIYQSQRQRDLLCLSFKLLLCSLCFLLYLPFVYPEREYVCETSGKEEAARQSEPEGRKAPAKAVRWKAGEGRAQLSVVRNMEKRPAEVKRRTEGEPVRETQEQETLFAPEAAAAFRQEETAVPGVLAVPAGSGKETEAKVLDREEEQEPEEEEEKKITGIECPTVLRRDYCLGSTEEAPELAVYEVTETGERNLLEREAYEMGKLDTCEAGEKSLTVKSGAYEIRLPYEVKEYMVTLHVNGGNYPVESVRAYDYEVELPGLPHKVGCLGGAWYWDAGCTRKLESGTFRMKEGETHIDLYAGYEEIGRHILDAYGYVTGYEGEVTESMILPEESVGVRGFALAGDGYGEVKYLYIPPHVEEIEAGAFAGLTGLKEYLVASEGNGTYCSYNGMLLSRDEKRLYGYPSGRKGEEYLPEGIEYIEDYAFYNCSISVIEFASEEPPKAGGENCFGGERGGKVTLRVPRGSKERYREAFEGSGWNGEIEEW